MMVCGNSGYSASVQPDSFDQCFVKDQLAFIDVADIIDLIEENFTQLTEEEPTTSREEHNQNSYGFDQDADWPLKGMSPVGGMYHCSTALVSTQSVTAQTVPLYLLHRIFRI